MWCNQSRDEVKVLLMISENTVQFGRSNLPNINTSVTGPSSHILVVRTTTYNISNRWAPLITLTNISSLCLITLWRPLIWVHLHPMPDRVKLSFVIFDIWTLWRSGLSVRVPRCQKLHMTHNPGVWHRMLYSWTHISGCQRVKPPPHLMGMGFKLWQCVYLCRKLTFGRGRHCSGHTINTVILQQSAARECMGHIGSTHRGDTFCAQHKK